MTRPIRQPQSTPAAQRGAALIMGLILLLVLTLLAVSGMNSASLEFIMAGNEQYRQNAFQAAESGIEITYANLPLTPGAPPLAMAGVVPNAPTDSWAATLTSLAGGASMSPPPNPRANSFGRFSYFNYEIQSTGISVRGGRAVNVMGISQIGPANSSF
jgi:type IV pilus assembly protein PilX